MSDSLQQLLEQLDRLSADEQRQVMEYLRKRIPPQKRASPPKFSVRDFYGVAGYPLVGTDAQTWMNQLREEWKD
ncbi:MAG: hypothetical protein AAFX40_16470 [Cyanobacteria bacterium J06639_1]